MKYPHLTFATFLLSACALLTGCGGGDGVSVVSGTVRNQSGATVANAEVIAIDRLSGREFNTLSDEQGRYHMDLPNGHYDLGADDAQLHAAHIVALRSLNDSVLRVDFDLLSDEADDVLRGTIYTRDDQVAPGYRLVFDSNYSSGGEARWSVETQTDAQGNFQVAIGDSRHLDVEIYDAKGEFVEFVPLHKLSGALRVDITLGEAADNNRYRHDEPTTSSAKTASIDPAAGTPNNKAFTLKNHGYELDQGQLPQDSSYLRVDPNSSVVIPDPSDANAVMEVTVLAHGIDNIPGVKIGFNIVRSAPPTLSISFRKTGGWWSNCGVVYDTNNGDTTYTYTFWDSSGISHSQWAGSHDDWELSFSCKDEEVYVKSITWNKTFF